MIRIPLKNGADYIPTETDIDNWTAAYPGIDVRAELRKMAVWSDANPARRKTPKGIKRFIVNWLASSRPVPPGQQSTRERTLEQDLTDVSWSL
jgi:hypothetical protein